MNMARLVLLLFLLVAGNSIADNTSDAYPSNSPNCRMFPPDAPALLPMPQVIKWQKEARTLNTVSIICPPVNNSIKGIPAQIPFIKENLTQFLTQHEVPVTTGQGAYIIRFKLVPALPGTMTERIKDSKLQEEAYQLDASSRGTLITATSTKGLFYGLQTLKQLIIRRDGKTSIALCQISDWPEFIIRGFMNDVGRNFMSIPLILKELDSMAALKMNVYQFHVTENEAWRLESKLFPQLNDPKHFTRKPGKFYTQKEFKQLVEYCRLRNIQLIPEMDMPGHCACFRKALGISHMNDPKATDALVKLIGELCSLVPADKMPYIHIGTDEARGKEEQVDDAALKQYFNTVEQNGRKPLRWHSGLSPKGYNGAIQQLWTERQLRNCWPTPNGEYIDSLETYLNHLDPQQLGMTLFFRRPCPFPQSKGLGFILCSWPDLPIEDERNQVLQTPVYSGMAFISEPLWRNPFGKYEGDPMTDDLLQYTNNLPPQGDPLLLKFAEYENRVLATRDRFFKDKEFNYVRQANIPWKIIGPFPHGGNTEKQFPIEEDVLKKGRMAESYSIDGKEYKCLPEVLTGATMIFKHYCDNAGRFNGGRPGAKVDMNGTYYAMTWIYSPKAQDVPFWISGHTWATSDWRNGPVSVPGKWFHSNSKFWVNGKEIAPPKWAKPHNGGSPVDENYHFRAPTMIPLKKGWNPVLIKSPGSASTRRWMFTFVPVQVNPSTPGCNVKEFPGLKFSVSPSGPKN